MTQRIVFLFSGQGSQYFQMGRQLYEAHNRFRLWMDLCDELAEPLLGVKLKDVIYGADQKDKAFDRLRYSNPALIAIEYALAKVLMESGCKPHALLGYSLGELTAAAISNVISLSDTIRLSIDYADIMEKASPRGSILAVLDTPLIIERHPDWFSGCYFAGSNFDNHFVVSGLAEDIQRLHLQLKTNDIVAQILPVNYAFHSPIMDELMHEFLAAMSSVHMREPKISLWSACTGSVVTKLDEMHFWRVVRDPIQFSAAVRQLSSTGDYVFIDVGPSGTLATFVKYLLPHPSGSIALETLNQYGRDLASLGKLTEKLESYRSSPGIVTAS